jgi:hypothetical protein
MCSSFNGNELCAMCDILSQISISSKGKRDALLKDRRIPFLKIGQIENKCVGFASVVSLGNPWCRLQQEHTLVDAVGPVFLVTVQH